MASKRAEEPDGRFEVLYQRLEETVSRLEQGGLSLQESIGLYEDGMTLAQRCQELLKQAELKITRLQEAFADGTSALREEPAEYGATTLELNGPEDDFAQE